MGTFNATVASSNDNALERAVNYFFTKTPVADLGAGLISGESGAGGPSWFWCPGVRFNNVTVAQGATITSAKITYTGRVTDVPLGYDQTIYGDDVDDSVNFVDNANIISRTRTTASASWTTPIVTTADTEFDTADLTSIVQEIVDRAGWASGNDMTFMSITTAGTADNNGADVYYYANSTTKCAKLTIVYADATAIKTVDGLAKASVKTVDGLAIASVKTWNGLA